MNVELVRPRKQNVWGSSAVALFTLGGAGSGMYLLHFLTGILRNSMTDLQQPAVFKLLPPLMVFLGFFLITLEAGRPLRGLYTFLQLRSSWMSREILSGTVFAVGALLDWIVPRQGLQSVALIGALFFMISQAGIIYDAKAVRSWNTHLMLWLSLTTGLSLGIGLILLITGFEGLSPDSTLLLVGVSCITLNLLVWLLYAGNQREHDEERSSVCRPEKLFFIVGIGQVIPILTLFLILWRSGEIFGSGLHGLPAALSGLAVIASGIVQRKTVILETGYLRGISLGLPGKISQDTCLHHRDV